MKKPIVKIITCPDCMGSKKSIEKSCKCNECVIVNTCSTCGGKGEIKVIELLKEEKRTI